MLSAIVSDLFNTGVELEPILAKVAITSKQKEKQLKLNWKEQL